MGSVRAIAIIVALSLMSGAVLAAEPAPTTATGDEAPPATAPSAAVTPAAEARPVTTTAVAPATEVLLAQPAPPPAVEEAPKGETGEKSPGIKMETRTNGYIDSRFTYMRVDTGHLLPTKDFPGLANLTEANLQLKLSWVDKGMVYSDLSFVYQGGTDFQAPGGRYADHDVPSLRPVAVVSELYGIYNFTDHLNLTIGKKRVVWGPGFAYNPTDILNPAKDPTDPTFQRAGSWLARLEVPFRTFTLSFVGAAKVLRTYGGLPSALVVYPDYPTAEQQSITNANPTMTFGKPDNLPHFAGAARAYWLLADTDINLFYYYTNVYNDQFEHKSRIGASASHVFGNWEVHFEGLFQLGYSNVYATPSCVTSPIALESCGNNKQTLADYTGLNSSTVIPKVLAGARYQLDNNGMFSLEYFYNGEGYTPSQFRDYVSLIRYGEQAVAFAPAGTQLSLPGQTAPDPGLPQKFTFNPLRRHYLFVSYQQPQIHDDWMVSATVILDLEDLSGQFAPYVTWTPQEWLNVTIGGFVGIPGVSSWGATVPGGSVPFLSDGKPITVAVPQATYTEFTISPLLWQGYIAVRAFY